MRIIAHDYVYSLIAPIIDRSCTKVVRSSCMDLGNIFLLSTCPRRLLDKSLRPLFLSVSIRIRPKLRLFLESALVKDID